ncbi:MAG: bifunctional DNA-formamidopyrimidine glycosylase/DNA-(apurinic or apyrimidinic site) lyase [Candidatus Portnoybacteria bacterium]|nr:bifunctional DNA-formamidopyrimidine glycosylase/DNA-(apurinic or apyrimidinic site) lyase [Candidatus Portnoybacteria bacterium]
MPELPEVETIVRDLNKKVKGLTIKDAWTDWKKMIKKPASFKEFKKQIKNKKILKARRRAKYILIDLSQNKTLIIHQKISGHLLYGKWKVKNNKPISLTEKIKKDPQNRFIRFILYLNKNQLALCDLRRFAKILLISTNQVENLKEIKELGPEPLKKEFTFNKFKQTLKNRKGKIKQVLMNPKIIAGIGNIYSDEILFKSKIHPEKRTEKLKEKELRKIYDSIKQILTKSIKLRGDSMSDFRDLQGSKGKYQTKHKVYQRENEPCYNCKTKIRRIKIGGRSAHFCPKCQK